MNELDTRAERFPESIRAEGEAACAAIREGDRAGNFRPAGRYPQG